MSGGGLQIFLIGITDVVNGITSVLGGLITFLTGVFTGDWQAAWDGLSSIFTGVFDVIKGIAESFFGTLTAGIEGVTGALQGVGNFAKGAYDATIGKVVNKVAGNASGTSYWQGGLTRVNESGGEIMNLPSGTQIIPHDASRNTATAASGANVTIPKLADTIVVREDADIDRITDQLVRKLMKASGNMGSVSMA
jgi:phage-related protein